jgi:hypothetical protein
VDLDFEPRWVTKDENGWIGLWEEKPTKYESSWFNSGCRTKVGCLKLTEFSDKDWQECIYEVPRWGNPDGKILKLQEDSYYNVHLDVLKTINELVDAVNELKGE